MIADWNDAYANGPHIAGAETYPPMWQQWAAAFRDELADRAELDIPYGEGARNRYDLFRPAGPATGLALFIHGGYWRAFDKSTWSHLARGAVDRGWAVAIPSYTLAPEARIAEITVEISRAIAAAAERVDGPVHLAGHSAGGHLVSRMLCRNVPLDAALRARIRKVVSISGLHDLRPLLNLEMNADLKLDEAEAAVESPVLQYPVPDARLTCWVGSGERPEFLRQNDLLATIWGGLGAETDSVHADGKHHFDVIEDLADATSDLTRSFTTRGFTKGEY
ncbi:alpha/beta hydrolase [Nisaea nitritireducens]|uniref:alpha/beta hydrolase n=1 Tax=Nisaea nitritireducens TaxID=568392 RepID=UPI001868F563|nr:alpha/beta hydrolase [Nisaea nitritireducens]